MNKFKQLTAVSLFMAVGLAQASDVVIPSGGWSPFTGATYEGALKLSYSADLMGGLDVVRASVTAYGGGAVTTARDSDGFFSEASQTGVMTSMTLDSDTGRVVSYASSGGATWTVPSIKSVTSGGSLTVTDLSVDYRNKQVFATLIGANGVGTLNNFHLWDFRDVVGSGIEQPCSLAGPCQYPALSVSGLTITSDGFAKLSQSLGLQSLGRVALYDPVEYGVIASVPIPEPSSEALMALGLAGVLAIRLRRPMAS